MRQHRPMRKVPGVGDARPTCCCLHRQSWKHARALPVLCPPTPVMARRQWGRTSQRRRGPWAGVRVGEAEQPGPSTVADELLQQRARAADALARARTSLPPFPPLPPQVSCSRSLLGSTLRGLTADARRPPFHWWTRCVEGKQQREFHCLLAACDGNNNEKSLSELRIFKMIVLVLAFLDFC